MRKVRFIIGAESAGLRLDQCLAYHVPELSRSRARVAIDLGAVFVNKRRVKVASRKLLEGQAVVVHLGGAFERATKKPGREARDADEAQLPTHEVLFEDDHLVVVNKPAGLITSPTPESDRNNLLSILLRRSTARAKLYVVQRLDQQTSGVLMFAKSARANEVLSERLRLHDIDRQYDVLAVGPCQKNAFTVRQPLAGKAAQTDFRCLWSGTRACHLEATLHTGRTHQIRRHLLSRGLPVLADPEYARREPWHPPRMGLHAKRLGFLHPTTSEPLLFQVPLPDELSNWLKSERSQVEMSTLPPSVEAVES